MMAKLGGKMTNYIAIVRILGGSTFARGADRGETIKRAARLAKSDWGKIAKLKRGDLIAVQVADLTGCDDVWWDGFTIYRGSSREQIPAERIEWFEVKLP
jgi:hypothetical protein